MNKLLTAILSLAIAVSPVMSATVNVRYVNPLSAAGGNGITEATTGTNRAYNNPKEWADARGANLTDTIERVYCVGFSTFSGQYAGLNFWGHSCDATSGYEIIGDYVTPDSGSAFDYSKFCMTWITTGNDQQCYYLNGCTTTFKNVQFRAQVTHTNMQHFTEVGSTNMFFYYCLFKFELSGSGQGMGLNMGSSKCIAANCIFMDCINGTTDCRATSGSGNYNYLLNCTFHNNYRSTWAWGGATTMINCVSQAPGTKCYEGGSYTVACSSNVSSDASSPNVAFRNMTVDFVDEDGDNFHPSDNSLDIGTDMSAYGIYAYSTDLADVSWTSGSTQFGVGALKYVSVTPPAAVDPSGFTTFINRGIGVGIGIGAR